MKIYLLNTEGGTVAFRFISSLANYLNKPYHHVRRNAKKYAQEVDVLDQ